jgi:photosystem II stability/assembly factor-like uncharacterized protein
VRRFRVRFAVVLATAAVLLTATVTGASPARPKAGAANAAAMTSAGAALRATANDIGMGDPDVAPVGAPVDRQEYLRARAEQIALYRGAPFTLGYNARQVALRAFDRARSKAASGPTWSPIGPAPIPNGQTTPSTPVSGRVTAIVVDPNSATIVYVGTAQGGLYRSTNGGTNWTPLMDNAASLAIGALALSADGTKLYVGTGEGNLSGDSYAGVGVYRIDNPATTATLNGPFDGMSGGAHAFKFTSITGIAVDPSNADRIYVASTAGGIGMAADWLLGAGASPTGLYRSTNATSNPPTFTQMAGGLPVDNPGNGNFFGATDVKFMPGSSSVLLVGIEDVGVFSTPSNGIWRTTSADQATPVFSHITLPNSVFNTRIAVGPSNTVIVAGETTLSGFAGRLYRSTDAGATFPTTYGGQAQGFCGGQCFYDMAPAIDPNNAANMLVGGSADSGSANILIRTADGLNPTPTSVFASSDGGLHADSHATAYAPSDPSVVYAGNDGGIYKSLNGGATWTPLNNTQFSATQFQSVAVDPTDPKITLGGTQDNGTPLRGATGAWTRSDFGDGGFAALDQNTSGAGVGDKYHTYFQQQFNLVGYAFIDGSTTPQDNWGFRGCSDHVTTANTISCSEDPLFYAPLVLGPGNPNTVYYGTDRLHRSTDNGATNPVVSQIFPGDFRHHRISAIGISPQNDNVRVVGLNGGGVFGTVAGFTALDDLDPTNAIPNQYVSRVVIDPTNSSTAYVTLDGFLGDTGPGMSHVWKTTNLNASPPTWIELDGNGSLPDVPVNAFVVDPADTQDLYAGTDVGVFASTNGGTSWAPFGTGLPAVAVFDMAIASPGTANEVLRVATHGKGMWDAAIGPGDTTKPTASMTKPSKAFQTTSTIKLAWTGSDTGGSGLANFDVQVRKAPFDGGFGSPTFVSGLHPTTGTTGTFTGAKAGFTYCFSVRARDNAGNVSSFSNEKCTALPVDDATLTASPGWTRQTGQSGAYKGTISRSTQQNATLTLAGVQAKQVGILATTCPTCGSVRVTFGGTTFGTVSLVSSTTKTKQLITFPAFSSVKTSDAVIKITTSGKTVQIDGLAARRA